MIPFEFQIQIWGYHASALGDVAAETAETKRWGRETQLWDQPSRLDYVRIVRNGVSSPAPDWMSLPWVTEHVIREGLEGEISSVHVAF